MRKNTTFCTSCTIYCYQTVYGICWKGFQVNIKWILDIMIKRCESYDDPWVLKKTKFFHGFRKGHDPCDPCSESAPVLLFDMVDFDKQVLIHMRQLFIVSLWKKTTYFNWWKEEIVFLTNDQSHVLICDLETAKLSRKPHPPGTHGDSILIDNEWIIVERERKRAKGGAPRVHFETHYFFE